MAVSDRPRSFIAAFVGLIVSAIVAMLAVNIVIDPFWRFDLVNIPGVNQQRTQFSSNARLAKAGVVCRLQPGTLILGTSRVEVGINPQHAALQHGPGPVYNMALAGSGLHEIDLTLRHTIHASPGLKRVLLGLDFLMFNAHREAVVFGTEVLNFDEQRLLLTKNDSCLGSLLYDFDGLLGSRALVHSLATIVNQRPEPENADAQAIARWIANYDRNGYRDNFDILDKRRVPLGGYQGLFGDSQERHYVDRVWRPAPEHRYCFAHEGRPTTFETLRGIVQTARAAGIDLQIFINPIHARLLLAVREAGLWPLYEDWKRGVVDVLATDARASGKPQFALWDFSGFNEVTTERVPPLGDVTTIMKGFWEPSHYKSDIGALMLDRILDHRDPARVIPDDFGKALTPTTIASWIAETRAGMRRYMQAEPAEAALVEKVVDEVMVDAAGSNCGEDTQALRAAEAARRLGNVAAAEAALSRAAALREIDRQRYAEIDVPYRETAFEKLFEQASAALVRLRAETKTSMEAKFAATDNSTLSWESYQARGIERSNAGDYRGAAQDFAAAIRLGPPNTALHYQRGVALLNAAEYEVAATEFEIGLRLEPANAALAHLLTQAKAGIETKRSAALASGPITLTWEAYQARGIERSKAGDHLGAAEDFAYAIRVGPPNTALHFLRGVALLNGGEAAAAASEFETGLRLEPANAALAQLLKQARETPPPPGVSKSPD